VHELQAEVVLEAHASVGEGPSWDARTGTLVWVDIMGSAIHIFDPSTGKDRSIDVGLPVGAAALREQGGLVLAMRDGFGLLDSNLENLRMVADIEADVPQNRFNDGKCDAAGRFWAGSMGFTPTHGTGSLYRLDPDFRVARVLSGLTLSNGLDWSADNRTMYFIDSPTQAVDAFDFDLERGVLGTRRRIISIPKKDGLPDGMTLDAEGGIWVALHGSGTVRRYLPDGSVDVVVRVPSARLVTCPAFGGPDLTDLYITTMRYEMTADELAEQPLAGALFRCRPGIQGRLANRFAG
jgi:sugar lactone lactonase YvrE